MSPLKSRSAGRKKNEPAFLSRLKEKGNEETYRNSPVAFAVSTPLIQQSFLSFFDRFFEKSWKKCSFLPVEFLFYPSFPLQRALRAVVWH